MARVSLLAVAPRFSWVLAFALAGCPNGTARECRDVIQRVNANVDRATTAIQTLEADGGDAGQLDELVHVLEDVKADFAKVHVNDAALRGHVERYDAMLERMVTAARAVRTSTQAGDSKGIEHGIQELSVAGKDEDRLVVDLNGYCGTK